MYKAKSVIIREAQESDAKAIIQYIKENQDRFLYMISKTDEMKLDVTYEKQMIKLHDQRENSVFFIAVERDKVIGMLNFVGGNRSRDMHDGEFGLSVHKDYFGRGIGSMLMDQIMRWGQNNKVIKRMTLFVMHSNKRAINLYKRYGFSIEGVRRKAVRFEDGRVQDLIMMGILKREGSDEWIDARQ
ncbi:MAG: GNAT family protein [Thermotogota bacterium]|nr:GNAT family protein [Thermotogota bacterium]